MRLFAHTPAEGGGPQTDQVRGRWAFRPGGVPGPARPPRRDAKRGRPAARPGRWRTTVRGQETRASGAWRGRRPRGV